ncbi:MAG: lytic transglycosylase domain-containing protein [Alphaproteobacteria bacterium]|nr:MAG: lytic transglycosylase domain-containing protein [Alphaproteobacteria bacterium]
MVRMAYGVCLLAILMVPVGFAEMRGFETNPADISPAAGPDGPSLLDERAEEIKEETVAEGFGSEGEVISSIPARAETERKESSGQAVSASGQKVLSNADAKAYREAFARARRGDAPNLKASDDILAGEVRGLYLLRSGAGFDALNGWLKDYRDLPLASEVYERAQTKREKPRQVCESKSVTKKVKSKKKDKDGKPIMVSKTVKERDCKTVGSLGPAPIVPLAVEKREARRAQRDALRENELSKLPAEGRRIVGQSWRLRGQKKYDEATALLLAPGARVAAGNEYWQAELVKIADYHHGQRNWQALLRAAEPAATVSGPERDEARWLAGYANYVLGNKEKAADQWDRLVIEEPHSSPHYARAAWWGARAMRELGNTSRAKSLLQAGAKDSIGFYGQLCAARLGQTVKLDWSTPRVDSAEFAQLQRQRAAKRGLALAQIGEVSMAQKQLRAAYEDLPYGATRALAASAVQMGLPATALYAGKQLREQGDIMPPALFPLAEDWSPNGGWKFDRALMVAIMRQESAFQPEIGSHVGAQGLMQLMPATAKYIARLTGQSLPARADLHDPGTNLKLAQDYLHYLNTKLDGNQLLVVAAYNGGIGNVQRWLSRGVTPGHDPVLWLESIPFDETRDYVEKVFANYWLYQQRLKQNPVSLQALAEGYWPLQYGGNAKTALK